MIRGLYTSSAGMQVEQLRQEAIANNLANLNTAGFRRDLAIMEARKGLKLSRTNIPTGPGADAGTRRQGIGTVGTGVMVQRMVKDFTQGDLRETENPFDLALQGTGFFTVQGADGKSYYSRDGQFTRAVDGTMVDKAGCKLMGQGGPIVVSGKLEISPEGIVSIDGRPRDRLALVQFDDPERDLAKHGDTMFKDTGSAGAKPATGLKVFQGSLEGANVNSVQEMVHMIAALRQYEANQKAVQSQDETLARAVNDIAK
jgi:flagellar basal-body rod protein FlgG